MASFKDGKGEWLPVGSDVWVNGGETSFAIGYDGETYLTGLSPSNTALIKKPDGSSCNASFEFAPDANGQVRIPGVVCLSTDTQRRRGNRRRYCKGQAMKPIDPAEAPHPVLLPAGEGTPAQRSRPVPSPLGRGLG